MTWGIAAGIVPKYAFSKNREYQTFSGVLFFIFLGISLKKISWKNKYRRRCECTTYIDGVFSFSTQQPVNGYIQDVCQGIQLNI